EVGADIIAASAIMSTTVPYQKDIIDLLESKGLRDKYRVMVGGGVVTQEWADKIGADGYGELASDAVEVAKKLVAKKKGA
ncbi:MAG: cobalamin-dependent protein, partial [Dehalococcoidia bacterium]